VDFKKSDLLEEVYVPVYPQLEDTICVLGADNKTSRCLVFGNKTSRCLDPDELRRLSEFLFSF
jgi:hypothetical protein